MALIIAMPPEASAGKNLTTSSPYSSAISTSEGVEHPGVTGIPLFTQYSTTLGLSPGLTMNFAPAATARSTCSVVSTVPAPVSISGSSLVNVLITSSAAAVLNVTSAHAMPPASSALPRGSASFASSRAMTGTMPILPSLTNTSFIL